MAAPFLVISFHADLGNQVRRILRKSDQTVSVLDGDIPDEIGPAQAIILVANRDTDVEAILERLNQQQVPLFLIHHDPARHQQDWNTISIDRLESDLLPEIKRHTSDISDRNITVWTSDFMSNIRRTIERVGPTDLPVLITGESGTGKEVVARSLHEASNRKRKRLVVVDCAAIAPTLMESELFGHQKGAFTGAATTTRGLVREAHNNTFFLDEIGELPTPVQVKLLRLLQDGSYRPVGGTETRLADLRIVAATNRDIETEVTSGRFRRDLYHRLNGVRIHIPPLRERVADIEPLFQRYLTKYCRQQDRPMLTISNAARDVIQNAYWPGNVRELVNCAHFVVSLAQGNSVEVSDLPPALRHRGPSPAPGFIPASEKVTPISSIRTDLPYKEAKREWLDIFEGQYIQAILQRHQGNVSEAAKEAGMDRRSIQRMMKRIKIAGSSEGLDE